MLNVFSDSYTIIIVSNNSISNNVAISITYIYFFSSLTKKILYYTINIITIEVELFIIRYGIN